MGRGALDVGAGQGEVVAGYYLDRHCNGIQRCATKGKTKARRGGGGGDETVKSGPWWFGVASATAMGSCIRKAANGIGRIAPYLAAAIDVDSL